MANRLEEALAGQESNYLLPFVWQHGEDESVIREEMARVFESGIRAVCVEARPHPDFLGPQWWKDMDIIMEEARARGMRVWILDDDHFPTGHAAGKMKDAPAELRRSFLCENHLDAIGPRKGTSFLVKPFVANDDDFFQGAAKKVDLVAVVAARRDVANNRLTGELIDLTDRIQGDFLYWDVPEGCWRIFFLTVSQQGGAPNQADYLNPLISESTRVLLDAVYEPFYTHYGADFGQTFAGFFSDEPGFYNDNIQLYSYDSGLGRAGITLPWRSDLLQILSAETGLDYKLCLPLLWHEGGDATRAVRYAYMNGISKLYGENFTQQLGDWCRARGVEYIGHVIEDNGAHTHLGCGSAHYFRALWGQDMAGLDVVLWQLAPGFDSGFFTNVSGEGDGEFYHYGLAKMSASLAHLDPKKHGRTMCEIFGAYGWVEGLKLMKWMTDHMLVRGVNYFVPHAFSQAGFPDPDCPPHMYARGMNPQYRFYRQLNQYTNRISHLLTGGTHIASVAVLYHAEAEWSGSAMPFHKPVKELMQHQIDCDVLPVDVLLQVTTITDGLLRIEGETYQALVVPESQSLPERLLVRLIELAGLGLPVVFINRLPELLSDSSNPGAGSGDDGVITQLAKQPGVRVVPLSALAQHIKAQGWHELEIEGSQPYLRGFHIRQPDMDVFMFTNEHPYQMVETRVSIPHAPAPVVGYDAFQNRVVRLDAQAADGRINLPLRLSPYESLIVLAGEALRAEAEGAIEPLPTFVTPGAKVLEIHGPWAVSIRPAGPSGAFAPWQVLPELRDLSKPELLPTFSGTFRYAAEFTWTEPVHTAALLLGDAYETVEVWLNGQPVGTRICPPYALELHDLQPGVNRLSIEVTNTLVKAQQDFLSRFSPQDPSGLLGPVMLTWK